MGDKLRGADWVEIYSLSDWPDLSFGSSGAPTRVSLARLVLTTVSVALLCLVHDTSHNFDINTLYGRLPVGFLS